MNYEHLIIFKIYGWESNNLKSLLEKLPLYTDNSKLTLLDNFIRELYEDFHYVLEDYDFKKFITYLLKPKNSLEELSLLQLFGTSLIHNDCIKNIIKLEDDKIFFNIIKKYSNIFINKIEIPLDPLTNLTLSNKEFNINSLIFNVMINNLNNYV